MSRHSRKNRDASIKPPLTHHFFKAETGDFKMTMMIRLLCWLAALSEGSNHLIVTDYRTFNSGTIRRFVINQDFSGKHAIPSPFWQFPKWPTMNNAVVVL